MEGLYKVDEMPTEGQFIGVEISNGGARADTYYWKDGRPYLLGDHGIVVNPLDVKDFGYTFYVADRRRGDRRRA